MTLSVIRKDIKERLDYLGVSPRVRLARLLPGRRSSSSYDLRHVIEPQEQPEVTRRFLHVFSCLQILATLVQRATVYFAQLIEPLVRQYGMPVDFCGGNVRP